MKKSTLRCLILTCLFELALCGWNKYIDKNKKWAEARDHCRKHYTDLSSVSNQKEDVNLQQYNRIRGWIGLQNDGHGWKLLGGQNASFFNWLDEDMEPIYDVGCVVHSARGWRARACDEKRHFYCFQNDPVLVKESKTWVEAMEQCRMQHKGLVSLPYEAALTETLEANEDAQTDHVWTGLRYLAGDWLWVSGENATYQPWSPTETPHCPAWTHHCGALSLKGKHLVSWDCADELNFICDTKTSSP